MSEAEQGDEQSLEDILSSIREKISATPDMSVPASPALDTSPSQRVDPFAPSASNGAPSSAQPKPQADVYPGGLSDVLNRIDAAEQSEENAGGTTDHDLSDLLDEPLSDPAPEREPWNNNAQTNGSYSADLSATNPVSSWPPNGLSSAPTGDDGDVSKASFSNPNDLGSFVAEQSKNDESATETAGGLTARLKAADQETTLASPDEIETEIREPTSQTSARNSPIDANSVPRSMAALSSGFTISNESTSTGEAASGVTKIHAPAPQGDNAHTSTAFGSSENASLQSDASAHQSTLNAQQNAATASERIKLSVSASNPQPVSTPTPSPATSADQPSVAAADPGVATAIASPFMATSSATPTAPVSSQGLQAKTIEDMVAEMLRPMLHEWLEANLPRIVENALRIEVSQATKDTPSSV